MDTKEKEAQRKEWLKRNQHVLKVHAKAWDIAASMTDKGCPKQDIVLLGEILIDIGKRFD